MDIHIDDYILGYWIASDNNQNDWYGIIKRSPDQLWHVQYTFRYHKSDDAWANKDDKHVYKYTIDKEATETIILNSFNKLFEVIKLRYSGYNDHFLVQGNSKKFIEIAKTKNYMHARNI